MSVGEEAEPCLLTAAPGWGDDMFSEGFLHDLTGAFHRLLVFLILRGKVALSSCSCSEGDGRGIGQRAGAQNKFTE